MSTLPKISYISCLAYVMLFALSYLGFIFPAINYVFFILIGILVFFGGLIKWEFALLASFAELVIGGHGYLFSLPIFGYSLSLRVLLFTITITVWVIWKIKIKKLPTLLSNRLRIPFILFVCCIMYGFIMGIVRNGVSLAFFDVNAYVAFFFIPLICDVLLYPKFLNRILTLLLSGAVVVAFLSFFLLANFSLFHYDESLKGAIAVDDRIIQELEQPQSGVAIIGQRTNPGTQKLQLHRNELTKTKPATYRWLRDTGTAQISYISGKFFRIFFQSHIMLACIFSMLTAYLFFVKKQLFNRWLFYWLTLGVSLFISYSRSLWLGIAVATLVIGIIGCIRLFKKNKRWPAILIIFFAIFFASLTVTYVPTVHDRLATIFSPEKEVAATHRIALAQAIWEHGKQYPIFGSGFGTTLIFPTVLPNGDIIKIAFFIYEWAYLDVATKIGLVGLFSFLYLVGSIFVVGVSVYKKTDNWLALGAIGGLTTALISNITTPVLIHPLGIGMLAMLFYFILYVEQRKDPNSNSNLG